MDSLQWYDYIRIVIMVLDVYCLYISGQRFMRHGHNFTVRLAGLWWVLNAFLILQLEGTLEQMVLDIGVGPRTALSLAVAVICAISMKREEGYVKDESPFLGKH